VVARGAQDLTFAGGQRAVPLAERGRRQAGIDHPLAGDRAADRRRELMRGRVLEEEPGCAALHRPAQVARPPERGQNQNPNLG
jgi:hypothetical protein